VAARVHDARDRRVAVLESLDLTSLEPGPTDLIDDDLRERAPTSSSARATEPRDTSGEDMNMSRTTGLRAIVVTVALWGAGCVDCGSLKTWQGGERASPINSVMSLRFHLCDEDWASAAEAIAPGSEYSLARRGDSTEESFWREPSPIAGEGELLFPLGPEDAIGDAQPLGTQMQVEIRHARRYEKDPRPRGLVLEERSGQWLVVAHRNW